MQFLNQKAVSKKSVFVVIYNEVEGFPPTLNAILLLSARFERVIVLELSQYFFTPFAFPENVIVHKMVKGHSTRMGGLRLFLQFTYKLIRLIRQEKPDLILFYDAPAAMSIYFLIPFVPKKIKLWYHNHDILQRTSVRWFSILFFASIIEKRIMPHVDLFSLPAEERKPFFNLEKLKGKYFTIPNYPSLQLFGDLPDQPPLDETVKILFQGSIGEGRGLEEIINLLPVTIKKKKIQLVIRGIMRDNYQQKINDMIDFNHVHAYVEIKGIGSYEEMPVFTSKHQIGLAVFTQQDIMNITLGTASNKVYEYTACGIPFFYYDQPYFRKHFQTMTWAIPTDLSKTSLLEGLKKIIESFDQLSKASREDFRINRNYENVFIPVLLEIIPALASKQNEHKPLTLLA